VVGIFKALLRSVSGPALALFVLASLDAIAAEQSVSVSSDPGIDTLLVTANRMPTERLRTGSTTYVVTADDIEQRQYRTAVDVLRTVPGMTVTRSGPQGGLAYVKMRGAASGQTLVLVDGAIVNDPAAPDGAYDFAFLDTADIERIEVLSGPQSTLYGSDAMGGVINIITKSGRDQSLISGYAEGGSYNTGRIGVQTAGGGDLVSGRLSVDYLETDGISKADENDGNTEKDNYDNLTVSGRLGVQFTDTFSLTANARYIDSEAMYDGFVFEPDTGAFSFADADLISISTRYSGGVVADFAFLDGRFENKLGVNYSSTKRTESGADNFGGDVEGDRTTLSYQGAYALTGSNKILFGGEYEDARVKDPAGLAETKSLDSTGVFALYQFAPVDSVDLTLGLRNDNYEDFGSETTGRVTGAWNLVNSGTTLRSSLGSGFKAPTIFQLGYSFGPVSPLENLKPETSVGWDAGIEQQFDWAAVYVQVTYFSDTTKDAITFVETFVPEYNARYENVDEVRRKGVELVFGGEITSDLSYRLTGTYVDARNETTNERLSRVPRLAGAFNVTWAPLGGSSIYAELVAQGDQDNSTFDDLTVAGFGVLNLGGEWQAGKNWSLFGRVENLLDKEYQEVLFYGTPDRSYYAGFRVSM
jgi:vitamin B12 transporter